MTVYYRVTKRAVKDPDEQMPVRLNWFEFCANRWQANEYVNLDQVIRPESGTGFAYQAQNDGTTGSRRPRWPVALDGVVTDGSVQWKCIAADTNGLNPLVNPTAVSEPAGLTIGGISVEESTKLLATYSGGVDGQDYAAVFTVTLNGLSRVARQLVQVRKR